MNKQDTPSSPAPVHRLVGQPVNIDDITDYVAAYAEAQDSVIALARVVSINSQPSYTSLTALRHAIKAFDEASAKYQGMLDSSLFRLPNSGIPSQPESPHSSGHPPIADDSEKSPANPPPITTKDGQ